MSDAEIAAELARAAELFNAAEYHEAHEVLDALWENSSAQDSDFFKGLIQAAIALHHYSLGNADGARKLYSGHRQYLGPYLPRHRGLDVAQFLARMQECLAGVLRSRPGSEPPFDPARRPLLEFRE
jgi:predicted metal-dependent hydrolase